MKTRQDELSFRGEFWDWRKVEVLHLQSLGDALHLQHVSSQHCLGAEGLRRDEERRFSLLRWGS